MDQKKKFGGAIGILFLGLCLSAVVVSAAVIIMSNVAIIDNHVTDIPGTVEIVDVETAGQGGLSELNALPASPIRGIMYDAGVHVTSTGEAGTVALKISVGATGISATDLIVRYWTGSAWTTITFVDDGDVLTGTIGSSFSMSNGYDATTELTVQYATNNDYQISLWVETL
ncbi:MAG TPA: hypothetical protein VLH13_01090 [Methanomassiliicoccales archaeon]|nr:hypothetical protein [Methanomassiliicoccales archaeon]